jgi:hypothetical protein
MTHFIPKFSTTLDLIEVCGFDFEPIADPQEVQGTIDENLEFLRLYYHPIMTQFSGKFSLVHAVE